MSDYYVAWWNVENLFDVEESAARPEWLQRRLGRELEGWDERVLARKVEQLAAVITRMNDKRGPDLLGVCEVENEPVLARLAKAVQMPGRDYRVVHHDSPDGRGIDVAFIYDANRLEAGEVFGHHVLKRRATRDIVQVNFRAKASGRTLVVVGNHWPSRSGGMHESEPYRIVAAETLAYWMTRIPEYQGDDVAVLVMGDFNDEPFDRSMRDYALSTRSPKKVLNARTAPRLLNLMWPLMGGPATHYFNNFPNMLDQFLVSKSMLAGDGGFRVRPESVEIVRYEEMVAGSYKAPRRFGRPSKGLDEQGFSDHFPIGCVIEEG